MRAGRGHSRRPTDSFLSWAALSDDASPWLCISNAHASRSRGFPVPGSFCKNRYWIVGSHASLSVVRARFSVSVRPQTTTCGAEHRLTGAGAVEEEGGYSVRVAFLGAVALSHEAEPALYATRGEQGADGRRAVRHDGLVAAAVRCDVEASVLRCREVGLGRPVRCLVLRRETGRGDWAGSRWRDTGRVGRWARSQSDCAQRFGSRIAKVAASMPIVKAYQTSARASEQCARRLVCTSRRMEDDSSFEESVVYMYAQCVSA